MKFITFSIEKQQQSDTIQESNRMFNISCNICCNRGLHIDCEKCPIKAAHSMTIAILSEKEKENV